MNKLKEYIDQDPELKSLDNQAKDQGFAGLEELFQSNKDKLNQDQITIIKEVMQ